jgi:hypothetical protein
MLYQYDATKQPVIEARLRLVEYAVVELQFIRPTQYRKDSFATATCID